MISIARIACPRHSVNKTEPDNRRQNYSSDRAKKWEK